MLKYSEISKPKTKSKSVSSSKEINEIKNQFQILNDIEFMIQKSEDKYTQIINATNELLESTSFHKNEVINICNEIFYYQNLWKKTLSNIFKVIDSFQYPSKYDSRIDTDIIEFGIKVASYYKELVQLHKDNNTENEYELIITDYETLCVAIKTEPIGMFEISKEWNNINEEGKK